MIALSLAPASAPDADYTSPCVTGPAPDAAAIDLAPIPSWYAAVKAGLDLGAAALLLPVALPLIAVAALVVRLTSPGPAFYTQTRVGRLGRTYRIIKLRTMYHRCEERSGVRWSHPGDTRVTPVGRLLRATHVDELPQLFNVLMGQMSLVGPRPERPEVIRGLRLDPEVPGYRHRVLVRPGLTGLAQLQLPPDTDVASVRRKLAYDLYYVRRHGPWLDLRLLLATPLKLVGVGPRALRWLFRLPRALGEVPRDDGPAGAGESDRRPDSDQEPTAEVRALGCDTVPVPALGAAPAADDSDWRAELGRCLDGEPAGRPAPGLDASREEARLWLRAVAVPALADVAGELRRRGRRTRAECGADAVGLRVSTRVGGTEMDLKVRVRVVRGSVGVYVREIVRDGHQTFVAERPLPRPFRELDRVAVIRHVVGLYHAAARRAHTGSR
ncbi:MAG TPA: sugar transferase [Urbifossiella sp.]|nr:sugar transferase [Urbifossiella sp.]